MPNVPPWGEISTYISIACTGWEHSSEAYPDAKAPCPLVAFIKVPPAGSDRVKGAENRSAGTPTLVTVQSAVTLFKFVTDKNDMNEEPSLITPSASCGKTCDVAPCPKAEDTARISRTGTVNNFQIFMKYVPPLHFTCSAYFHQ